MLKMKKYKNSENAAYQPDKKGCPQTGLPIAVQCSTNGKTCVDNTSEKPKNISFSDVLSTVIMPKGQMPETGGNTKDLL